MKFPSLLDSSTLEAAKDKADAAVIDELPSREKKDKVEDRQSKGASNSKGKQGGEAGSRDRLWFPLGEGRTVVNGLEVEQLPEPLTEEEMAEQREEWSKVGQYSRDDVDALLERMRKINHDELAGHHDPLPTPQQLSVHYAHLPKWALAGALPKWRSPTDRLLVSGEATKIWRYIYRWTFIVPTVEGDRLLEELAGEGWKERARELGLGTSFREMVHGVRQVLAEAKERGQLDFHIFDYIGMGARSELQVNSECRAFAHLCSRPHSLFGIALDFVRSWRSKNPSSTTRLVQTFLTHLPLDDFRYSGRIFVMAELIFAVLLRASPVQGGCNTLSCGEIDLANAYMAFLEQFDASTLVSNISRRRPISLRSILIDKAIKHDCKSVADLRLVIQFGPSASLDSTLEEEEGEANSVDASSKERWTRIRAQEKALQKSEGGLHAAEPERARGRREGAEASESHRKAARGTADEVAGRKRKKENALRRVRADYGIDSRDQQQLEITVASLPYEQDNITELLRRIRAYRSDLSLYRQIVTMLVYRATAAQGGKKRVFDNFFDLSLLSTANGAAFESDVLTRPRASNSVSILGFGVDPDGHLVEFDSLQVTAMIAAGRQRDLALKWDPNARTLELTQGGRRLTVHDKGRHVKDLVLTARDLKETDRWLGMASILGLSF